MYQKGDKYKVTIEGFIFYFRYIDEVIDHVECNTCFEVDSAALRIDLKYTNKHDKIELRDDCVIERVA